MDGYRTDLHHSMARLEAFAAEPGRAVLFQETGAQHFKSSDRRGYATGEWEQRDKSSDKLCSCQRTEDFNVNTRNRVLHEASEMQPRLCSRDAAEMQPRCSRDAAEMQPRC